MVGTCEGNRTLNETKIKIKTPAQVNLSAVLPVEKELHNELGTPLINPPVIPAAETSTILPAEVESSKISPENNETCDDPYTAAVNEILDGYITLRLAAVKYNVNPTILTKYLEEKC